MSGAKTYQTTIRLTAELGEALEEAAKATGRRLSDVVRDAIARQVGHPCGRCGGSGYEPRCEE